MIDVNACLKAQPVGSSRGAPMGRQDYVNDRHAEVAVQRVIFQGYGYDLGGAYWGGPAPLFCAMDEDGEVCVFIRASNYNEAVIQIMADWPDLTVQRGIDIVSATNGFLQAVLFAERDMHGDPDDDSSLRDQNYDLNDFSQEALAKAQGEVSQFIGQILEADLDTRPWGDSEIGANFYYDRSRHGCGFQDENHHSSRELSEMAKTWGGINCWTNQPAEGQAYGTIDWS